MNLLGIDVGTTGCKVALFSHRGEMLASSYREYNAQSPQPGWAELDTTAIWEDIKSAIRSVMAAKPGPDVQALSVSSLADHWETQQPVLSPGTDRGYQIKVGQPVFGGPYNLGLLRPQGTAIEFARIMLEGHHLSNARPLPVIV